MLRLLLLPDKGGFMFKLRLLAPLLTAVLLSISSCSTLLTAYLVNELLNDKAPRRSWTGVITDQAGTPLPNLKVILLAEVAGDSNILRFDDTTDDLGKFDIKYRWSKEVSYTLRVQEATDRVVFEQSYGKVELADRNTNITITGSFGVQLSGVVRDFRGDPIAGALVIAATASGLTDTPTILLGADNKPAYTVTTQAGVYTLTGTIGRYGIICVYHPSHGFAYGYGEDLDNDRQVAINTDLGGSGRYTVSAQVIDGFGSPLSNRVLEPD
jgi:protocatechuate 3,4-dioxygenase beta subunit